jgi:ABC-type lipoprotein export system ATPase subunit
LQEKFMVTLDKCRRRLGPGVMFHCEHFHAPVGSHVALWGPSGCGKSTMLNLMTGLLRADSGRIVVDGQEIHDFSEAQLDHFRGERIGFVFQTFNLLAPFTALQNVLLAMRFSDTIPGKEWKPRAKWLLERVGLGHRLHSKPETLSVGERQRVALARALANKPKIIVADEPTGSLDPKNSEAIMELLLEICREQQVTMLLVTHERVLADRLPQVFDCHGLIEEVAS